MGRGRVGRVILAAAVGLVAASACGGGDDDGGAAAPPAEEHPPLDVLVTNDDGVAAEGIDALVEALRRLPAVEVTVVAPAEQQSGTGGQETTGEVASRQTATGSGYEATAVDGFPADAVGLAFGELGLEPDVVVSGVNEGQNLGPVIDVSGTVGAARAAVQAGVPALAVSQGLGSPPDYPTGVELAADWIEEHRAELSAGDLAADHVVNLNVPTCPRGEVRGTVEVAQATGGDALGTPDCTATGPAVPSDDVQAFLVGYATFSEVTPEPIG